MKYCRAVPLCRFGMNGARARPNGPDLCLFCDIQRLNDEFLTSDGAERVRARYCQLSEDVRSIALERVQDASNRQWLAKGATKRCAGTADTRSACVFALQPQPARAQVHGRKERCDFCDPHRMASCCASQKRRNKLKRALARMGEYSRQLAIEERIPEEHRDEFRREYGRAVNPTRRQALDKSWVGDAPYTDEELAERYAAGRELWAPILAQRGMISEPAATSAEYRKTVLDDRRKASNMMNCAEGPRHERGAPVSNADPLPKAQLTRRQSNLQLWCEFNSWKVCGNCKSMIPRILEPAGLDGLLDPICSSRECVNCKPDAAQGATVPTVASTPEALRGLTVAARAALRPVQPDFGQEQRSKDSRGRANGYREHTAMVSFTWQTTTVEEQIESLPTSAERKQAKRALRWLLRNSGKRARDSAYGEFYSEHRDFLDKDPRSSKMFHRPLRFIERVGLECALWPDFFPCREDTLTWVRGQTFSRKVRAQGSTLEERYCGAEGDESDDAEEPGGCKSTKRAYAALALAPALDVGTSYEVMHFAFDLNLWTALGSKRNSGTGVPLRLMLKGHPFSPEYWKELHWALVDLVRQRGYPPLFTTTAPFEWSFPYHVWVVDAMSKARLGRMRCAVFETLNQAHVILQVEKNFVAGANKKEMRRKRDHRDQLLQVDRDDGGEVDLSSFIRVEFQGGKRKAVTQDYHGSGRFHIHALHWVNGADRSRELKALRLDECMAATMDVGHAFNIRDA